MTHSTDSEEVNRMDWESLPHDGYLEYHDLTEELICSIEVPDALYCRDLNCSNDEHAYLPFHG